MSERAATRLTWAFVALGVLWRALRYALDFPLWGDEAMLAVQLPARGAGWLPADVALEHNQVAPVGFLWLEQAAVAQAGFHEWSLRLVPFAAGAAALLLMRRVATRLLEPREALVAVAFLAVSYYPVRHGAEVKPYALDLALSLALTALAVEALTRERAAPWLWALALLAPLAVWLSFPAVFVAGGALAALAVSTWRQTGRPAARRAWLAASAALVASFAAMALIVVRAQAGSGEAMFTVWGHTFPPLERPLALPGWLIAAHTGRMFAHPAGGSDGGSALTTVLFVVGLVTLARRGGRGRAALALLLLPFALNLVAAALAAYPYGGSARWMLHLAPAVCLLAGLGAARLVGRRPRVEAGLAVLLALAALFGMGRDLVRPFKNVHDREHRDFARRFWTEAAQDAVLVCATTDLGLLPSPEGWARGHYAQYLCNQRLYSPRHAAGRPPELAAVSATRPLRVALFARADAPLDEARLAAWAADLERRYALVATTHHAIVRRHASKEDVADRVEVRDYVPRP